VPAVFSTQSLASLVAALTRARRCHAFTLGFVGRVKTLHPKIHGGLLGVRGNAQHEADMAAHGIAPIDLVVVNLYAFEATVAKVRAACARERPRCLM